MRTERKGGLVLLALLWLALVGHGPAAAQAPAPLSGSPALVPFPTFQVSDAWAPRAERQPETVSQKSEGGWGSLSAQVEINDGHPAWDDPLWSRAWKADQSYRRNLMGPLSVFGQLGANSDEAAQQNMKVAGRTGLACRLPMGLLGEYTLRGGPGLSYTDPLRPTQGHERADWLVEVQARWPLMFGIGVEYSGSTNPSPQTPLDQTAVNQDLRLAFPLGGAAKVKVGARHRWAGLTDPRPWTDGMQLYMGVEWAH